MDVFGTSKIQACLSLTEQDLYPAISGTYDSVTDHQVLVCCDLG